MNQSLTRKKALSIELALMVLGLAKKPPVLDDKSFPDASRNLNSISNKLALLAQLQINLLGVVLSSDVRHIDGDQNIRVLLFEAQ